MELMRQKMNIRWERKWKYFGWIYERETNIKYLKWSGSMWNWTPSLPWNTIQTFFHLFWFSSSINKDQSIKYQNQTSNDPVWFRPSVRSQKIGTIEWQYELQIMWHNFACFLFSSWWYTDPETFEKFTPSSKFPPLWCYELGKLALH